MLHALLAVVSLGAEVPAEPSAREATRARLDAGEILLRLEDVAGSAFPAIFLTGVVDQPPDAVWEAVSDCAHFRENLPHVRSSEVIWKKGNLVRCKVVADVPVLPDLTAITDGERKVVPGKKYELRFHLVEGDFKSQKGAWILVPFDASGNRTLVRYEVHAEPKMEVPPGLQRIVVKQNLPGVITWLRKSAARIATAGK